MTAFITSVLISEVGLSGVLSDSRTATFGLPDCVLHI
jgi:hypothetical protein